MDLTGTGWRHAALALLVYASAVRCEPGPDQEDLRRSVRPCPALPAAIATELAGAGGQATGRFRTSTALAQVFSSEGVRLIEEEGGTGEGLTVPVALRLVRSARAASRAFGVPPAVLLCLVFRESSFRIRAIANGSTAKGLGQLTNPAVAEIVHRIRTLPELGEATRAYAAALGASVPAEVMGAPEVDRWSARTQTLRSQRASAAAIAAAVRARDLAIEAMSVDQVGGIFNLETNIGLTAAYLAYLRRHRFADVADEERGWLTAVAAFNQGPTTMRRLIDRVGGPVAYAQIPHDRMFAPAELERLGLRPARARELGGEVTTVRDCAIETAPPLR